MGLADFWDFLKRDISLVGYVFLCGYCEVFPDSPAQDALRLLNSLFQSGNAGIAFGIVERFVGLYKSVGQKLWTCPEADLQKFCNWFDSREDVAKFRLQFFSSPSFLSGDEKKTLKKELSDFVNPRRE